MSHQAAQSGATAGLTGQKGPTGVARSTHSISTASRGSGGMERSIGALPADARPHCQRLLRIAHLALAEARVDLLPTNRPRFGRPE